MNVWTRTAIALESCRVASVPVFSTLATREKFAKRIIAVGADSSVCPVFLWTQLAQSFQLRRQ